MSTPTEEQINHLQSLLDAGTPGEWRDIVGQGWIDSLESCGDIIVQSWDRNDADFVKCHENRALIVELHNLAPALLEAARENLRLREALEEYRDSLGKIEMCSASMSAAWFEARKALGKETV